MDIPFVAQYAEARGYAGLARAGRAFAAGPTAQTAWTLGGSVVGVLGPDKFINAAIRYTSHLITRAGEIDQEAAEEIVALAQSRAPRRSGRLAAGIAARQVGRSWTVGVEAQAESDGENYGSFVEWGTAAGYRGRRVAGPEYFAGARAGRRSSDGHPGTPPHPFFVSSYGEVLSQRGIALEGISDDAAAREDLL